MAGGCARRAPIHKPLDIGSFNRPTKVYECIGDENHCSQQKRRFTLTCDNLLPTTAALEVASALARALLALVGGLNKGAICN